MQRGGPFKRQDPKKYEIRCYHSLFLKACDYHYAPTLVKARKIASRICREFIQECNYLIYVAGNIYTGGNHETFVEGIHANGGLNDPVTIGRLRWYTAEDEAKEDAKTEAEFKQYQKNYAALKCKIYS